LETQRTAQDAELRQRVDAMLALAAGEGWSQRELTRRACLKWSSWCRLRTGQMDPAVWLPRLRHAAARLNTPTQIEP